MNNQSTYKPGYKHTPLGWIPEEWQIKQVGDVCDFIVPGRNKPTTFDGDIPWITTPDIDGNATVFFSKANLKISREEAKKVGSKIVPKNAVIMSCVGELGLLCISGNELVINQQLHAFIPKEEVDHYYLFFALGIRRNFMERVATKTAVPYMNKDNCNSIPIFVPAIIEQRRIATILSTWDEAINQTQQLVNQLRQRNKGLMQQLLTGKKRLKGFNDKWVNRKLENVIEEYKLKSDTNNQFEVLTSSRSGLIRQKDYFGENRIAGRDNEGFNVIPPGYITYRSRSDDGRFTFNINEYTFTGIISVYYPVFNIKEGSNQFFVLLLNMNSHKIGRYSVGTSQLVLSINDLKQIHFDLPCKKEQGAIAGVLINAFEEVKLHEQRLVTLQQQKKGLMQKLLTGEVRVKIDNN